MSLVAIALFLATAVVVMELLTLLRRGLVNHGGHAALLAGDLFLLGWAIQDLPGAEAAPGLPILAALAQLFASWQTTLGLGGMLLLVAAPRLLAQWIHRAIEREDMVRATSLASLNEILAPGRAATAQREVLEDLARARGGRLDEVVRSLRQRLGGAEAPEDSARLHERILGVLVFAGRFREAAQHFEQQLAKDHPAHHPSVAIHMVRCYGELGELERAAAIVRRLEQAAQRRGPLTGAAQAALLQARLFLVAFAAPLDVARRLLAAPPLQRLPPALRDLLDGTVVRREAAEARGARSAAGGQESVPGGTEVVPGGTSRAAATRDTAAATDGEGDAAEALAQLDRATVDVARAVASTVVAAAGGDAAESAAESAVDWARLTGERLLAEIAVAPKARSAAARVTVALIVVDVAVYLLLTLGGRFQDGYDLVRAGASFHAAIRAGEWWRLVTALFLHDGSNLLHVTFNMLSLWVLGRTVEPLLGWGRFLVVYVAAGLCGNVTSLAMSGHHGAVMSLGASGAIFGLVAALIVFLALRRSSDPERRPLIVNLLVLAALQLSFGAVLRGVIDQWAHIGGAVGGALAGLVLLPGGMAGAGRRARAGVAAATAVVIAILVGATAMAARTSLATTMARVPSRVESVGPIRLTVPAYALRYTPHTPDWPDEESIADPVAGIDLSPHFVDGGDVARALEDCMARDREVVKRQATGGGDAERAPLEPADPPSLAGLDGWLARAQRDPTPPAPVGERLLYVGRALPPASGQPARVLVVELQLSGGERHRVEREAAVARMLRSIELPK